MTHWRVQSTVGGEQTTFVGPHYEVTNPGANQSVTKYYFAGAQRIAMRKDGTLSYMLGDHLGSTSLVTDSNGALITETKYKACPLRYRYGVLREGEVRYNTPNTTLSTRYTFTGQYSYVSDTATDLGNNGFGLMFYNARWYDSTTGRFAQADSIVPGGVQGLDRYAYVSNNPMNFVDPSGHLDCKVDPVTGLESCSQNDQGNNGGGFTQDELALMYGITFGADEGIVWTYKEKFKILSAAYDIGSAIAATLGGSAASAFSAVYQEGLIYYKSSQTCAEAHPDTGWTCWGETIGNTIIIYANANVNSSSYNNFLVHEMGHAFDNAVGRRLSQGYSSRFWDKGATPPMPSENVGYACYAELGDLCSWIMGYHIEDAFIEEVADMFLGWVYNQWGDDPRRANWMHLWMPVLLTTGYGPSRNAQDNCYENTGIGC
jgi:RHS repeat-associated protein